jgi:squalene synthase HpnC
MQPHGVDHYENFPVASVLVPAAQRAHIIAVYRFARLADDIADEGDAPNATRLAKLSQLSKEIDLLFAAKQTKTAPQVFTPPLTPEVAGLWETIYQHNFTPEPFQNLLSAFRQDVETKRYASREALLNYCQRSANPVGRMVLTLFKINTPQARAWSDQICTGLQLTNFWQDVAKDAQIGRIYIPEEALKVHRVSEAEVMQGTQPTAWRALMHEQVNWAQLSLTSGVPLLRLLPGRMKWEIALTIAGGLRVLAKLRTVHYDVYSRRPTLSLRDAPALCLSAVRLVWRATFNKTL